MQPVDSTAEILYLRMLNRSVDKRWADWAYDMLVAGYDTESPVMLAGEVGFYNQFEMERLADKAFEELGLRWDDRDFVLRNYASYFIEKVLTGKTSIAWSLDALKEIYLMLDYESIFHDFYLLAHAKRSLDDYGFQYYWDGATKENINEVVLDYFREWLEKNNK